jgi:hypothetical protein
MLADAPLATGAALSARLEVARSVIETKFSHGGDLLEQVVDGVGNLGRALDEITHALDPDAIADTTAQLHDAASQLAGLPAQQQERRATIAALERARAGLADHIADMRRSFGFMRAFTVSIKITAGGIPEAEAEFSIFAEEMRARIAAGRDEVDALQASLEGLRRELGRAGPQAEMLEQGCAAAVLAVPGQLREAAELLAQHQRQIGESAAQAASLARDVRKKTSSVLSALQIGDTTRQRVEHVQSGLVWLDQLPPAAAVRAAAAALLSAQLAQTAEVFGDSVVQIKAGIAGLAADGVMLRELRDHAAGKGRADAGGSLGALAARMAATAGLVSEIEQADSLARETGAKAAAAAQSVSERLDAVQKLRAEVLYMALNTTLKAAKLGEPGRPLATIASELRVHAGNLERIAAASVAASAALIAAAAGLRGGGMAAGATLAGAVARIAAAHESGEQQMAKLSGQGEDVLALLAGAPQEAVLQSGDIQDGLDGSAAALAALAAAGGAVEAADRPALSEFFGRLFPLYTMAREREVHAQVAASFGIEAKAAAAPAVVDDVEDALF